jgi:hypothetical protein
MYENRPHIQYPIRLGTLILSALCAQCAPSWRTLDLIFQSPHTFVAAAAAGTAAAEEVVQEEKEEDQEEGDWCM